MPQTYVLLYKNYEDCIFETEAASFDRAFLEELCLAIAEEWQYEIFCEDVYLYDVTPEEAAKHPISLCECNYFVEEVPLYGC